MKIIPTVWIVAFFNNLLYFMHCFHNFCNQDLTTGDPLEIKSDLTKSFSPQELEDYLLVLPLQFRFLRKDSPLLQN